MLKAVIPESKAKIQKQIESLESILSQEKSKKDKELHIQALNALKEGLKALELVENTPSNAGRPKVAKREEIQFCKKNGMTQEETARELNVSISTVKRNWN